MSRPPARTRGLKRHAVNVRLAFKVASSREDAWIETPLVLFTLPPLSRVLPRGRVD